MSQSEGLSEKTWVAIWKRAARELEAIRRQDIRCVDTQRAMHSFGDAFEAAVLHQLLAGSSGMVEMQRLFSRIADGAVDQNCR
jgi:hypothetical protein